jgi:outer membrane biosynthesis protein TonB
VKAQVHAAQATYEYICEAGFDAVSEYEWGKARTISFTFMMEGVMRQITVPLLAIIPLPYLQIDTVDISFTADVSVNSEGKMMAKVANATDSEAVKQSSLNYQSQIDIDIKASSAGNMPVGIAKLLDLFGNNCIQIEDVEIKEEEPKPGEEPEPEPGEEPKPEPGEEPEPKPGEEPEPGEKPEPGNTKPAAVLYNVYMQEKPSNKKLPKVVAAIVANCSQPITEESVMNAIKNSQNKTVVTGVSEEEADRIIKAANNVDGKLVKKKLINYGK